LPPPREENAMNMRKKGPDGWTDEQLERMKSEAQMLYNVVQQDPLYAERMGMVYDSALGAINLDPDFDRGGWSEWDQRVAELAGEIRPIIEIEIDDDDP
jgi:hypothetical protein